VKATGLLICFVMLFVAQGSAVGAEAEKGVLVYRGMCDASAAVALDEQTFVVGGDGSNVLRVYKTASDGMPVLAFDLTAFLGSEPVDIEGAARAGDRIYWIGSHSRDRQGQVQPSRHCFFATTIKNRDGAIDIEPLGKPCTVLMQKMVGLNTVGGMRMDKALRWNENLSPDEQQRLGPDREGLNIEALCASSINDRLHIGFRNPRPVRVTTARVSAAAVPLQNPRDVTDQGLDPIFGEGILWDFGGLGISSMEYSPYHKAYFVIAAPHTGEGQFMLYRWSGMKTFSPELVRPLDMDADGFRPEAMVAFAGSRRLLLLSDDKDLPVKVRSAAECQEGHYRSDGTCLNGRLADPDARRFRAVWLEP
jgi:hypothetical protein